MKTTIYLDVDGVINAVRTGTPSQKRTGFKDFRRVTVRGYQIQYAQELIDQLNTLAEHNDVTIKWLTTWEEHAPNELAPAIGLNGQEWEVLGGDLTDWGGSHWWKLRAIRNDIANTADRADNIYWIDDDIKLERPAINWTAKANVTIISPDPLDGLTQEHLEIIRTNLT